MNLQQTRALLEQYQLRPTRSLGQNFLVDERILAAAVAAVDPAASDLVLEIGPGLGSLTRELAPLAGRMLAIEIDRHLLPVLQEVLVPWPNARIIHADALSVDLSELTADWPGEVKVAANVPYYITSPLLEKILSELPDLLSLTVLLQKEAAARLRARPGSRLYGPLAILVSGFGTVRRLARVPAQAFYPTPRVDSELLQLKRQPAGFPAGPCWLAFLKACFQQRRKTLLNSLADAGFEKERLDLMVAAISQAGLDPACRPEQLSPQQYRDLYLRCPD